MFNYLRNLGPLGPAHPVHSTCRDQVPPSTQPETQLRVCVCVCVCLMHAHMRVCDAQAHRNPALVRTHPNGSRHTDTVADNSVSDQAWSCLGQDAQCTRVQSTQCVYSTASFMQFPMGGGGETAGKRWRTGVSQETFDSKVFRPWLWGPHYIRWVWKHPLRTINFSHCSPFTHKQTQKTVVPLRWMNVQVTGPLPILEVVSDAGTGRPY